MEDLFLLLCISCMFLLATLLIDVKGNTFSDNDGEIYTTLVERAAKAVENLEVDWDSMSIRQQEVLTAAKKGDRTSLSAVDSLSNVAHLKE